MDEQKIWQKTLELIKEQISAANFRTWFSQTRSFKLTEKEFIISVPSAFIKGQLQSRYQPMVEAALNKVTGQILSINYQIDPSLSQKKQLKENEDESIFNLPTNQPTQPQTSLNPKYTLENFVVGMTNNLAYAAAQAISQNPGTTYNPLFVYGPSGVGKTHLMQAIGNSILKKNPYSRLIYASSERFLVDFIDSLQNKRTGDFRQKYRSCDVLLIDDIQFIAGKDSAQEEFFHTFNELYSKNAQIILTSDRPPNDMQKLESRLMSRFQGGLMVDIQLPDLETRLAILKAKLSEKGENLPEECLVLIAESVQSNSRELEGKLIQILQMSKLTNQELNTETIRQFLGTPQTTINRSIDHKKVLNQINQYFNVKLIDITGPRRQKELVLPRQIAMFLMYTECKLPMEKIGDILGGRDHTTVLHGIEKIKDVSSRDREVQKIIIELKQQITS